MKRKKHNGTCSACMFDGKIITYSDPNRESHDLCEICESSYSGIAYRFPDQYPNELAAIKTIAYVGNLILRELRKR